MHLVTVIAMLGFLGLGSVALRTLNDLAMSDTGPVLLSPSSAIRAIGDGVLQTRLAEADARWSFVPEGARRQRVDLQRAVFAVAREGTEGPITRFWLNHVVGHCPVHGEFRCQPDALGRAGCASCGAGYRVTRDEAPRRAGGDG